MDILSKYNQWNSELEEKYLRLWPKAEYHIWDGVISPQDYLNSPLKIMFLNKEAYDPDIEDISETLKEELESNKPIFNNKPIKDNLKNRLSVLRFVGKSDFISYDDEVFCQYTDEEFYRDMLNVAYCNIKKSDGLSESNTNDLKNCFARNKPIIEEQISFFNPSLIVGGNIVDGIMDGSAEWGENLFLSESHCLNIFQLSIKGKLYPFIDMYHPSYHQIDFANERKELFNALLSVDQKCPMFWKKRCANACFMVQ